ncbi:MAG: hypothetical protein B6D37_15190 [Sphingobacteriales bacterium UTBCD1]|jgi:hypothetical protein|nr:MAG: hypothetical protein B6D37_15190 [Sphingobacteriales bacterium UTBCD1]
MRKLALLLSGIGIFFSVNLPAQKANSLSKKEKKQGWQLLFDGKTMNGWHKYGDGAVGKGWKVTDGAIFFDPSVNDGGDIVTDREFKNFHLKLEWKVSTSANSGIMIYVHEDISKYKAPWMTGPEMQVLDNLNAEDNKKPDHLAGALYDLIGTADKSKPKPVGEWNEAEIKCVNGKLDMYLNGIHTVSTTLWDNNWEKLVSNSKFKSMPGFGTYKTGHIDLQDHGYRVWFRNIRIRAL